MIYIPYMCKAAVEFLLSLTFSKWSFSVSRAGSFHSTDLFCLCPETVKR